MILAVKIREKKKGTGNSCGFVVVVVVFLSALMPHWPRNWERLADSRSWGWWWQWDAQKRKWGNLFCALTCPNAPPPCRTLPFIFKTSIHSRVYETKYVYWQIHYRKPCCTCPLTPCGCEVPIFLTFSSLQLNTWLLICEALSPPLHTLLVPVWKK